MNYIKSKFFSVLVWVCLGVMVLVGGAYWDYDDFMDDIGRLDFSVERFQNARAVSRYDLTKALNLIYCNDCMLPSLEQKYKFNSSWWSDFRAMDTNYFDDIGYQWGAYRWNDYYYCVAHGGDEWYISGYPDTSWFCPWRFCGYNNTSYAELIQVLYNVRAQNQSEKYDVSWMRLRNRFVNLDRWTYEYASLTDTDLENIQKWVRECGDGQCSITASSQMDTYMHFCTYNPQECDFQEFDNIWAGTWPLGQANILLENDIMTRDEIESMNLYGSISGEDLLEYIYRMSDVVSCSFDFDYAWDGIDNPEDNCPYDYNPGQSDTSGDGIGDVCSDDIRGDGPHPVGVVDDNCNLIPSNINDVWVNINAQWPYEVGETYQICPDVQWWSSYGIDALSWKIESWDGDVLVDTSWRGLNECVEVSFHELLEHTIDLRGHNQYGVAVTQSKKNLLVGDDIYASLEPDRLIGQVDEVIDINTDYNGFEKENINYIQWDFDGVEIYDYLDRAYQCRNIWDAKISQKIVLNDGRELYNSISVVCKSEDGVEMIQDPGCHEGGMQKARAMHIYGDPLSSLAPQEVQFDTEILGDCIEVRWDFGDGHRGRGEAPSHHYQEAGKYNVMAQCIDPTWETIVWWLTVNLGEDEDKSIGMTSSCSPLVGEAPHLSSCNIEYEWDIDYIEWSTDGETRKLDTDDEFGYVFEESGQYDVVARWYDSNGNFVAQSISNIEVDSQDVIDGKQYGSDLWADTLRPETSELVTFDTDIDGFDKDEIANIERDFGDGQIVENTDLSTTKRYHELGPVLVRQNIELEDGTELSNELTLYVVDEDEHKGKWSSLQADPLRQEIGKPIDFELDKEGISKDDITKIERKFGDGETRYFIKDYIDEGLGQEYIYDRINNYVVEVNIHTDDQVFENFATVDIFWPERCSGDDIQRYQCDTAGDGIPDMCSPDISGDGQRNKMWILLYERDDCSIGGDNVDDDILEKQREQASDPDSGYDNCPFDYNPDQSDMTGDGVGDKCSWEEDDDDSHEVGSESGLGGAGGEWWGAQRDVDQDDAQDDQDSGFNFWETQTWPWR